MLTLADRGTGLFRFLHSLSVRLAVLWSPYALQRPLFVLSPNLYFSPIKMSLDVSLIAAAPPGEVKLVLRNMDVASAQQVITFPAPVLASVTPNNTPKPALPPLTVVRLFLSLLLFVFSCSCRRKRVTHANRHFAPGSPPYTLHVPFARACAPPKRTSTVRMSSQEKPHSA